LPTSPITPIPNPPFRSVKSGCSMGLAPRSKAQHARHSARRPRTQSANGIDHGFMNSVLGNFKWIARLPR
jgi:hypothetical protein